MPDLKISLPRSIARDDARSAIDRAEKSLREWPGACFVIGAVRANDGGTCDVDAAAVDFTALHWVILADSCLEWASKRLAAGGERELLAMVEQARAALDVEDRQHDG